MTRSVPAVVSTAVAQDTTQPILLIRMGWDVQSPDVERRICTWDTNISWNAETWTASGATIQGLSIGGGTLELPNGSDDPWLNLVMTQVPRNRTIQVYEYHTSTGSPSGSDAVELFEGLMDECEITDRGIRIQLIEGRLNKSFPHTSIGAPTYNYLLTRGDRIYWGIDVVMVE
jgi:hypothetical protein